MGVFSFGDGSVQSGDGAGWGSLENSFFVVVNSDGFVEVHHLVVEQEDEGFRAGGF